MDIPQIQKELLHLEYPLLMPDYDPDIERYFFLRGQGRPQDAMNLYQSRLKPRYPDDEFRAILMRCFRSHSPVYRELLVRSYRLLGERALARVRRIIGYIADKIESYNPHDVYATIKAAEDILLVLPKERYEAISLIERYLRYSQSLNLRADALARAVDLIRAYMTDSLPVVQEELHRRETAQNQVRDQERRLMVSWDSYQWQGQYGGQSSDEFSTVVFSPADLARVEIPRSITNTEDQVLAYCFKYWNLMNDPAFERVLFLYSRKYNVKNYDVYQAIRRGRELKKRDDEILASVMSLLTKGYYYSVRGDRYLQQQWNVIKDSLIPAPLALPAPKAASESPQKVVSPPQPKVRPNPIARPAAAKPAVPPTVSPRLVVKPVPPPIAARPVPTAAPQPVAKPTLPAAAVPRPTMLSAPTTTPQPTAKSALPQAPRPVLAPRPTLAPAKPAIPPAAARPAPITATVPRFTAMPAPSTAPRFTPTSRPAARPAPVVPAAKRSGSVSDRLKELSGRSYDVYQDQFFAKARLAIRRVLGRGRGIFFTVPEQAEGLVFKFLRNHYADPYMNWTESAERTTLQGLGFDLESLQTIIDECYKML